MKFTCYRTRVVFRLVEMAMRMTSDWFSAEISSTPSPSTELYTPGSLTHQVADVLPPDLLHNLTTVLRSSYDNAKVKIDLRLTSNSGLDLRGANWAVAQEPPQLRGLHKNSKNITYGNIKNTF